ncbi:hypothetical protein [Kitasatospora viridis]|uniref:Quercetin dioxygenase-like cupin family protein n=1 Tax=Kitasatospora viridis TaxID=281105 RepID=A0A561TSR8_9ACTN|nr:hypothetical protein [Kitasatospora viridis]TWF90151.1 hypothetical protein FHX73_13195 [Kitasatospora viridis]
MIATTTAGPTVLVGPGTERIRVRCLARRGMLHSETEAVDYVRLSPGACYDLVGRDGVEAAWYVLRGPVALTQGAAGDGQPDGHERMLTTGDLVLAPHAAQLRLHGGPLGAELLCLTVLPRASSDRLPPRRPDLGEHSS